MRQLEVGVAARVGAECNTNPDSGSERVRKLQQRAESNRHRARL